MAASTCTWAREAVATGVCAALRDDDLITSTHRGHGHCLAKGMEMRGMMAELMGKATGYCKGKGGLYAYRRPRPRRARRQWDRRRRLAHRHRRGRWAIGNWAVTA